MKKVISDRQTDDRQAGIFALYSLCCIFLSLYLAGCDRRELTYYMESEIEIHADWSESGLDDEEAAYGATAIFYPENGGIPKVVLMGNR